RSCKLDIYPTRVALSAHEPDPFGIGLWGQATGSADDVRQAITLRVQRVGPRIAHLSRHPHVALEVKARLPQDQHVVERLQLDLRSARRGDRYAGRAHVTAERITLEQVRRIHWDANRRRELSVR